jgi:hypothetical protein
MKPTNEQLEQMIEQAFFGLTSGEDSTAMVIILAQDIQNLYEETVISPTKKAEVEDVLVGHLNHPQGIKGFDVAEIGHPVFERGDRYVIYIKNENTSTSLSYYKDDFKKVINFL